METSRCMNIVYKIMLVLFTDWKQLLLYSFFFKLATKMQDTTVWYILLFLYFVSQHIQVYFSFKNLKICLFQIWRKLRISCLTVFIYIQVNIRYPRYYSINFSYKNVSLFQKFSHFTIRRFSLCIGISRDKTQ